MIGFERQHGRRARRGMSLVEMLVAVTVSAVIAAGTIATYVYCLRVTGDAFRFNQVDGEARRVSDVISRDLRQARGLDATFVSEADTYTTGSTQLIIRIPSIDDDGAIIDIDNEFDHVVYLPEPPNLEHDTTITVRLVYPGASSSRQSSRTEVGRGMFSFKEDLRVYVVHYQFVADRQWRDKTYEMPISGSTRLRNQRVQ